MKQSKKEIKAQLINELSKQFKSSYENKIENMNKRLVELSTKNTNLENKVHELSTRNEELEQKVNMYEDWIHRLQDFCNLSESDRLEHIESMKRQDEASKAMSDLWQAYKPLMNIFGL